MDHVLITAGKINPVTESVLLTASFFGASLKLQNLSYSPSDFGSVGFFMSCVVPPCLWFPLLSLSRAAGLLPACQLFPDHRVDA